MAEWLKAPDLKSGVPARVSRVRIPLVPPPAHDVNSPESHKRSRWRRRLPKPADATIHATIGLRDPVADTFGISAEALTALVARMVRRASGGVGHDLDDAAQDTLCRLLADDGARFDGARAVAGFVALRARWTLVDGRRRQARQGRADARYLEALDVETPSPEADVLAAADTADHEQRVRAVAAALACLDDDARSLLVAHDIDGVSLRVLAASQGVNVSTLSRRRATAIGALARAMA
jgi:RNA polymerase sigma factor (sigma-70 family)